MNPISTFLRAVGSILAYHSKILERPRLLDILQRLLQIHQLLVHKPLGLLRLADSLRLESLDRLDLAGDVVGCRLEALECLLDLIDHGLVLQRRAVVGEVDGLGLLGQGLHLAARIVVALLERCQGIRRLALEAERGANLRPVNFQSG